jgi:hypothetical protein
MADAKDIVVYGIMSIIVGIAYTTLTSISPYLGGTTAVIFLSVGLLMAMLIIKIIGKEFA